MQIKAMSLHYNFLKNDTLEMKYCCLRYNLAALEYRLFLTLHFISYLKERKNVCVHCFSNKSLFRYFESIKDGTLNVCKYASSVVLMHVSPGVLDVSRKEAT